MALSSLSELDFNELGEWPLLVKGIAVILWCLVIFAAGYYFFVSEQRPELKTLETKEKALKKEFAIKLGKTNNLAEYKEQFKEIESRLTSMLKQLPKEKEVADLLVDISRTGLINGLVFELFKPESEFEKGFYAELPVTMQVTGSYHQIGDFLDGLAELPRIVTVHDFSIYPRKQKADDGDDKMVMELTVQTYRYFESDDDES